jgi:hypothetical protein
VIGLTSADSRMQTDAPSGRCRSASRIAAKRKRAT